MDVEKLNAFADQYCGDSFTPVDIATDYVNKYSSIRFVCKKHGLEFSEKYSDIKSKGNITGCKECIKEKGLTYLLPREDRLQIFKENLSKHPDIEFLDFPNLDEEFTSIKHKIHCHCKKHNFDFYVEGGNLLNGNRCPKCAAESRKKKLSALAGSNSPLITPLDEAVERAKKVHNDKYDYSLISPEKWKGMYGKYDVICPIHGKFVQRFNEHVNRRQGCPKCSKQGMVAKLTKGSVFYLQKFYEAHGNRYDYSHIEENPNLKSSDKVTIVCPIHGEFQQAVGNHYSGQGCPKCAIEERNRNMSESVAACKRSNEFYAELGKNVHGNRYDYSEALKIPYKNENQKVPIICPIHGTFYQSWSGHVRMAEGCPECNLSKMEEKTANLLRESEIEFEREKIFPGLVGIYGKPLRFDFYLPQFNVCIECDGIQHREYTPGLHRSIEDFHRQIEYDQRKEKFCKEKGIRLIRISTFSEIFKMFLQFSQN